jgi:hypothetical protein
MSKLEFFEFLLGMPLLKTTENPNHVHFWIGVIHHMVKIVLECGDTEDIVRTSQLMEDHDRGLLTGSDLRLELADVVEDIETGTEYWERWN